MAEIWTTPGATTPAAANTISSAFKQQFADSYELALQKTESVLAPLVVNKGQIQGSSWTFQDMGIVEMHERGFAQRFSETKFDIPSQGTRMAELQDFDLYIPIEPTDIYRLTAQVDGPYMQLMVAAANRAKDKLIMDRMLGNVRRKEDNTLDTYGAGTGYKDVAFDPWQTIVAGQTSNGIHTGTGAGQTGAAQTVPQGLDKQALINMRRLFRANRADKETIYMLYNADMMASILGDSTLTSADYMAVQMLQAGDVASNWLGFQWIPYEELQAVAGNGVKSSTVGDNKYMCGVAFTKSAMNFATGKNYTVDIGTRYDLRLVKQLSAQMSFGAGRQNEQKIAKLIFDPQGAQATTQVKGPKPPVKP